MSSNVADKADKAVAEVAAVGMAQKPIEFSHPIHPATVHFPIGLWTASLTLNVMSHFTPGVFPQTAGSGGLLTRIIPPISTVLPMAHYLNGAAILTSTISIATGVSELLGMLRGQAKEQGGYIAAIKHAYSADDVPSSKIRQTMTHASLNDAVLGVAIWNFYKQAKSPTFALPAANAWVSAAVLPLFMYSAYLGGSLVYEYAVGVQRQGEGVEIAQKQKAQ